MLIVILVVIRSYSAKAAVNVTRTTIVIMITIIINGVKQ